MRWMEWIFRRSRPSPLPRGDCAQAAQLEPHNIRPELSTATGPQQADDVQIYLIWYEDMFHFGDDRDSFAICVCLTREEAEAEYRSQGRRPAESGGDGYEIVGPSPLNRLPPEVVREVLLRLRTGTPGPVPIPSTYW